MFDLLAKAAELIPNVTGAFFGTPIKFKMHPKTWDELCEWYEANDSTHGFNPIVNRKDQTLHFLPVILDAKVKQGNVLAEGESPPKTIQGTARKL